MSSRDDLDDTGPGVGDASAEGGSAADRPAADRPAADRPAADRPAPTSPAASEKNALAVDASAEPERMTRKKPKTKPPKKPPQPAPRGFVEYFKTRHDPLTSLVLTIPVFLIYHLGILLIDLKNGVDFFSQITLELVEHRLAYMGVTVGIAAALIGVAWWLRRRGTIRPASMPWVLAESVVLAFVMMFTVGWATGQVFANQIGGVHLSPLEKLVLSAGAGFHEEVVFRVVLFAGTAWALMKWTKLGAHTRGKWIALVATAVGSSLVFSAVHYIGAFSDDFTFSSFFFRMLSGLFLCVVYRLRGFAVVVWTHFLYDVFVFFF
jgi:hypothetical protein